MSVNCCCSPSRFSFMLLQSPTYNVTVRRIKTGRMSKKTLHDCDIMSNNYHGIPHWSIQSSFLWGISIYRYILRLKLSSFISIVIHVSVLSGSVCVGLNETMKCSFKSPLQITSWAETMRCHWSRYRVSSTGAETLHADKRILMRRPQKTVRILILWWCSCLFDW